MNGNTLQAIPTGPRRLRLRASHASRGAALAVALGALFTALPAQALFKVVGPDGKVTYTDRLPGATSGKVTPLSAAGNAANDSAALPPELKKAVERYPVTLFITVDCAPCDNARALLRQRGVPHAERIVQSGDDADALQRLTGTRDVPTLMVGTQAIPGLSPESWNAYLNAAGYPRESKLPAGYAFEAPEPLQARRDAAPATPPPAAETPAAPPLRSANGITF